MPRGVRMGAGGAVSSIATGDIRLSQEPNPYSAASHPAQQAHYMPGTWQRTVRTALTNQG